MRRMLLGLILGVCMLAGCRQAPLPPRKVAADDIVGQYAQQRHMSREQAEQCIQEEVAAARRRAVSSSAEVPASVAGR